jgi:hypothetical protein
LSGVSSLADTGVLGNDTDADGANLGATVVSGPAHGTLTLDDDGGYHYMPAANFRGQDSFTYRADDGIADSALATVTITVFPTTNVDRDQYVDGVYQVLLGRPSDFAGLAFWSGRLAGGLSRSDFTRSMEASAEGIDTQIRRSYLAILDRTPDPGGLAAWHAFLAGGGTTRALEANLAGSPEFFAGAGGTNADFVAEAYLELLGRTADSAGSTFWQNALAAGASRTAVAQAMMDSVEGLTVQITRIYLLALGRVPDLAGGTFWAPQVRFGDRRFVLAALTASDEFFALSTAG